MDSQLSQPKALASRLMIAFVAIALIMAIIILGIYISRVSDPYIQEVLTLEGDLARGYEIFQLNCAGCHGQQADGSVGPSLHHVPKRKSKVRLIEQVISGKTPPMPKFQPSAQEMADLLTYLEGL
ncbi:cytochrome c class I [Gloeothece citriformis PCC 7424]|uniref:Cytochrome c class I n=1 Tax=Gloeothece citriformis (strain PCC 7424) TaxID=65393 RepID=B7KHU8_GLOC7|nr:cytochrome c [Gloeothece citriformis]ACK72045.1 cytochrome c class I [Gloeothece citriformis PCC 7424]